jgi:two-component system phosphate regulon sensor histidine kinase PhoR
MRIFNASAGMNGKNILELMRDVNLLEHMRAALAGWRGETGLERAGRVYHVYFSPVPGSGAILFFLDVSEKMKAEKLRREFSANVSHELKTPLTSIAGYAEILNSGMAREEDQKDFLRKIKDETDRLISLVEDIMLLSRLDEGRAEGGFEEVDMAELARQSAQMLEMKARQMGVSLQVRGENVRLRAHSSLMSELLFNLLDNAIKYNKPGGRVIVELSQEQGQVTLSVEDSGIGIPLPEQSRVFERFYRVDKSRCQKIAGTGLGLAIVKHIAIIHNARITLDSHEDRGTRVTVSF